MLKAIENAKKLVNTPEWPRPIDQYPKDEDCNCWGFALDGMKIPALQKLHWHSDLNGLDQSIFDFLQDVGLNPRKISAASDKNSEEMVFLFYIFRYYDVRSEESRSECHVARIESNGHIVEKSDSSEGPVVTTLEGIQQRLYSERKKVITPIMFAVRKPQ